MPMSHRKLLTIKVFTRESTLILEKKIIFALKFQMDTFMNWMRKIWNDPVFSSLIAAGLIALFTFLFDKYSSINFLKKIPNWGWAIVIILFVLLIIYAIFKKFEYNPNTIERERKTFNKITTERLRQHNIDFMRQQDLRGGYRLEDIKPFFDFRDVKADPTYSFINPKLNKIAGKLFDNIIKVVDIISQNSTHEHNNVIRLGHNMRNDNVRMGELHGYASNIVKYYNKLVQEAHKLGL